MLNVSKLCQQSIQQILSSFRLAAALQAGRAQRPTTNLQQGKGSYPHDFTESQSVAILVYAIDGNMWKLKNTQKNKKRFAITPSKTGSLQLRWSWALPEGGPTQ